MIPHLTGRRAVALLLIAVTAAWADVLIEVNGEIQEGQPAPFGDRKIFVPEPKGAGETLDEAASKGKRGEGDTATTTHGDRIVGRVLTIDADGKLHLSAPHFDGEIVVLASALDTVTLTPKGKARGDDEMTLSNEDRIVGEIVAITPDHAVVESAATGPVKISRKIIQGIHFARGTTVSLESNFDQGRMAPWTAHGGGWSLADGALQCLAYGGIQTVFAEFEQKEAVTMEARVQATGGRYINSELIVFADTKDMPYGRNSIVARFYSSHFYLMVTQNGGTNSITNRSLGRVLTQATLRLAYDPERNKVRAWIDSNGLGEYDVPQKLAQGKFVMFNSRYPCRVSHLRVLRGIVAPSSEEKGRDTDAHVVRFANKDRVAASDMRLTEGRLSLATSFGEIASPIDKVQSITFRSKGIERPRRRKGDVWVETADSRFTLQFERLTPEHLVGKSSYLGEVKVRREYVKRIRFNIYK